MKKTLFLTALSAVFCSTVVAETTEVTVDGKTYQANILTAAPAESAEALTDTYILIGADQVVAQNYSTTSPSWASKLTGEQTIIVAPATAGETQYNNSTLFFDTGNKGEVNISANIIAGSKDTETALRFWGGSTINLNGTLSVAGSNLNIWNENATHKLNGALILGEAQTITVRNGGGSTNGTLNIAGDTSQLNGTITVASGANNAVTLGNSGVAITGGNSVKFSGGLVQTVTGTLSISGTNVTGAGFLPDGADRISVTKGGGQVNLKGGSEATFAKVTTTGTTNGWFVLETIGDTEKGLYTDIEMNSTAANNNGIIIGQSGTAVHIGALSGTATQAQVRGDWNGNGTDRVLVVHQDTDTEFAGYFFKGNDNRDVALTKEGTGKLTLTNSNNASTKALTIKEGSVELVGNWAGSIVEEGGTLIVSGEKTISSINSQTKMEVKADTNLTVTTLTLGTESDLIVKGALNANQADQTVKSVTLGSGSNVTLGTANLHNANLTTNALTVEGPANLNANLVIAENGTFTSKGLLTMGSTVTLGSGTDFQVTSSITEENPYQLLASVDSLTLGSSDVTSGAYDASVYGFKVNGQLAENYQVKFDNNGAVFLAVKGSDPLPEPTTGTLSLLALAGLMARRRRK